MSSHQRAASTAPAAAAAARRRARRDRLAAAAVVLGDVGAIAARSALLCLRRRFSQIENWLMCGPISSISAVIPSLKCGSPRSSPAPAAASKRRAQVVRHAGRIRARSASSARGSSTSGEGVRQRADFLGPDSGNGIGYFPWPIAPAAWASALRAVELDTRKYARRDSARTSAPQPSQRRAICRSIRSADAHPVFVVVDMEAHQSPAWPSRSIANRVSGPSACSPLPHQAQQRQVRQR